MRSSDRSRRIWGVITSRPDSADGLQVFSRAAVPHGRVAVDGSNV